MILGQKYDILFEKETCVKGVVVSAVIILH